MIDALIFDFDGVILDTETPDFETWRHEFQSYGVELERSLFAGVIGGSLNMLDVPQHLEKLVGHPSDPERIQARRRRYLDLIESSSLLPGVRDYLVRARDLGLKVGVASSSTREWVEGHLTSRGLMRYVDSIRTSDDVAFVKPDPELYLSTAESLGVRPEACLAIEDSANGLTAAKRAGMVCVAVPNPMTADMDLDRADLRLQALSDMPLAMLLDRVGDAN